MSGRVSCCKACAPPDPSSQEAIAAAETTAKAAIRFDPNSPFAVPQSRLSPWSEAEVSIAKASTPALLGDFLALRAMQSLGGAALSADEAWDFNAADAVVSLSKRRRFGRLQIKEEKRALLMQRRAKREAECQATRRAQQAKRKLREEDMARAMAAARARQRLAKVDMVKFAITSEHLSRYRALARQRAGGIFQFAPAPET